MAEELVERITRDKEVNKRSPKLLTVGFKLYEKDHNSRSLPLDSNCSSDQLANQIMREVFNKIKSEPIVNLSIAASKFVEDCDDPTNGTNKLDTYFTKVDKNTSITPNDGQMHSACNSVPITVKSVHTKTLNDFWKASTSGENVNNGSSLSINAVDRPNDNVYNPWNCSQFRMKHISAKMCEKESKEVKTSNITPHVDCDQTSNQSLVEAIEVNVQDYTCITCDDISEYNITNESIGKRGFFHRKLMEFRQNDTIDNQKRIREQMDTKNVDNVKRPRESDESPTVVDILED